MQHAPHRQPLFKPPSPNHLPQGAAAKKIKGTRTRSRGAHRELYVLEKLGGRCSSPATALLLGDALAALISGTAGGASSSGGASRSGKSKLDEVGARARAF